MSKPDTIYIVPAPGALVRDPVSKEQVPEAGRLVPRNTYWLRRLRDGDVSEGKAPPAPRRARGEGARTAAGETGSSKRSES